MAEIDVLKQTFEMITEIRKKVDADKLDSKESILGALVMVQSFVGGALTMIEWD